MITPLVRAMAVHIARLGPYVEMLASAVAMFFNTYTAIRLLHVGTYSKNFRTVMISTNFIVTTISVLRPITVFVPARWYSLEQGHYLGALVMCSVFAWLQVAVLVFDVKYVILAVERYLAYRYRATYEFKSCKVSLFAFGIMICVVFLLVSLKIVIYFWFSTGHLDAVMDVAFNVEKTVSSVIIAQVFATGGFLFGFCVFSHLKSKSNSLKYTGGSLSESFQIKEIITVINVLHPIVTLYLLVISTSFVALSLVLYFMWQGRLGTGDVEYRAFCTFLYVIIDLYNVYASCYMILRMKPLRRAFLSDWLRLCRFRMPVLNRVEPERVQTFADPATVYFEQLETMWNPKGNK